MTLLKVLLKLMMGSSSTSALSNNTGVSSDLLKKLLPLAIPILIKAMTKNASSNDGALSLLNALGQHKSNKSMADQLLDVDTEDGGKIIGHILGDNAGTEIAGLANQTGLSNDQVSSVLNNIAPSLLTGMSGVLENGLPEDTEKKSLLARLFGKKEVVDTALDGTNLLNALMALQK